MRIRDWSSDVCSSVYEGRQQEQQRAAHLLAREAMEIAGERQDQRYLHHFRRLQPHDAEIDPALRTHADVAHHLNSAEQDETGEVDEVGVAEIGRANV